MLCLLSNEYLVIHGVVLQNAVVSLPRAHQPLAATATVLEPVRTAPMAANQRPRYPLYADIMARIRSFDGKVIPRGQDVQELASAGFYHVGKKIHLGCARSLVLIHEDYCDIYSTVVITSSTAAHYILGLICVCLSVRNQVL